MEETTSELKTSSLFQEYLRTLLGVASLAGGLIVAIFGAISSDLYHSLLGAALFICGIEILLLRMKITKAFSLPALARRDRVLAGLFGGYVSEVTLERMFKGRSDCHRGLDHPSETALLFTNSRESINWFLSGKNSREEKNEIFHRFLDKLTDLVYAQDGMVIAPYKDGISALWGIPIGFEDGADRALRTALKIREFTSGNTDLPEPFRRTRVALDYGEAKLEIDFLMNYRRLTIAGASYCRAARLEEFNKFFGTSILITDAFLKKLSGQYPTLYLGSVIPRGISTRVYTIFQERLPEELCLKWLQALKDFSERNWEEAEAQFLEIKSQNCPLSVPSRKYLIGIEYFQNVRTPPERWKGELVVYDEDEHTGFYKKLNEEFDDPIWEREPEQTGLIRAL